MGARSGERGRRRRARGRARLALALLLSVVSLLIWARLRLVTGLPRTAYAVPAGAGPDAHRHR